VPHWRCSRTYFRKYRLFKVSIVGALLYVLALAPKCCAAQTEGQGEQRNNFPNATGMVESFFPDQWLFKSDA